MDFVAPLLLVGVLSAIFARRHVPIEPWLAMTLGAGLVLISGRISPPAAVASVDFGVLTFLWGMFVLGAGLEKSGYLEHLAFKVLGGIRQPFFLLCAFVFSLGAASAVLLNDTLAILGVPVVLMLSKKAGITPGPLLVGLALAVTIGSVTSPLGNPQNYLISSQPGFSTPFVSFAQYLLVPTFLGLLFLSLLLWHFFPELRKLKTPNLPRTDPKNKSYFAARLAFHAVLVLCGLRVLENFLPHGLPGFQLYWIALAGAGVYLAFSRDAAAVLRTDYKTLAFFAGMFVLMQTVWISGIFQPLLPEAPRLSEPGVVLSLSVLLSQVLSNVPFVLLYLKALGPASAQTFVLLAAGSTLAGCATVIGAASNLIVLQTAQKHGATFRTRDFTKVGLVCLLGCGGLVLAWMSLVSRFL